MRTAVLASYDHGDVPREFLFFNQTSPDVPDIVERIDELALTSGRGDSLRIQVDQEHAWPWAWYLREYDVSFPSLGPEFVPDEGAILIRSAPNEVHTPPSSQRYHPAQRYTLRWWFPEDYRGIGDKENLGQAIGDFAEVLPERRTWDRWWGFWFHREIQPIGGTEGRLLVPFEFDAIDFVPVGASETDTEPSSGPGADIEGRLIIGRLGIGPGEMQNPVGVALDPNGNVYVVDNHLARVLKFEERGSVVGELGGPGREPGQLDQPSDIAVDAAGMVYVADTLNHRIQKFGPDLGPAGGWGQPTRDLINPGPYDLWTPRAVAVAHDGTILVVDSATHRVRRYGPDGAHIADSGQRGSEPGEFEGPTGIAVAPDGSIYVADAGNARIQVFDAGFTFRAAWPLEEWADRLPANQPQIEALPDGRLIATDPAHSRVLLINTSGQVTATLDNVLEMPLFSPNGVAFDPETRFVYITDGRAGHVRRFPFTDFALR
jgi:DNA-binding beta-propeller fold protein YncE